MGYSKVELANQALDAIGKDRIASLSETSTAARKVNEVFDRTIESALARSHWSFCRKIASLSLLTNDWSERWAYKYDIPSDCVTVVRLVPTSDMRNHEPQLEYELMGGALYCNEPLAKAEYVFRTTNTTTMPVPFLDAVAFLLARNVSMPLTRKPSLWGNMNQMYEMQLGYAIEHDAGQEPTFYPQEAGGYIDDRNGTTGSGRSGSVDGSIYWE